MWEDRRKELYKEALGRKIFLNEMPMTPIYFVVSANCISMCTISLPTHNKSYETSPINSITQLPKTTYQVGYCKYCWEQSSPLFIEIVIMYYKVQLICQHPPHKCRCRHNIATEVNTEDLTSNLIKCNPALLKYLGRTTNLTQTETQPINQQSQVKQTALPNGGKQYRSIVEEKGLNFILRDNYTTEPQPLPAKPNSPKQKPLSPHSRPTQEQPNNPTVDHPQSPKSPKPPKPAQSERHKQVKDFHKQLRQQSRYLSNTAFRKYFDRQCFENYGNQNVHHKGDGFVYGNYLKTYNINPHTCNNMPANEETFYHALVSASPDKYALQTQEVKLAQTAKTQKTPEKQQQKHSLQKDLINVEQMLEDNLKHSHIEKKYEHINLKSKGKDQHIHSGRRSPRAVTINPHLNSQNNQSQLSPKQLPIQSRNYLLNPHEQPNKNRQQVPRNQKVFKEQAEGRHDKHTESILVEARQSKAQNERSAQCQHQRGQQSITCECCLNQMKGLILSLAESDPDLASRIATSAKKATLYKNYVLNNHQQPSMNPHNYSSYHQ